MKSAVKKCFICNNVLLGPGQEIAPEHRATVEHFIPKWMLRGAGMLTQGRDNLYRLPNYQSIKGPLTIDCCRRCNDRLGSLEATVKNMFVSGNKLSAADRQTIFLWMLKVAYGSAAVEISKGMSHRRNKDFGSVISQASFNRMRRFHGRVLKHFCEIGSISDLKLLDYSLVYGTATDLSLHFSKSMARNRVTVSWNGKFFRLTLDEGEEEENFKKSSIVAVSSHHEFYQTLGSEDIFFSERLNFPVLDSKVQKTQKILPKRMSKGNSILIVAAKHDGDSIIFIGHILEKGAIVAEENIVRIIIKKSYKNRIELNEVEIQQPGLNVMRKTAYSTFNHSPDTSKDDEHGEMLQALFIIHHTLDVKFILNPPIGLPVEAIP